ncbi:MAG TPA: M20/M25/M40 family metallo-hydrolase [Acidimicrobiia bacterium]|nr:M20/M25/M40 family metallo-hydrolase [Acidimicrobiia bacterium]
MEDRAKKIGGLIAGAGVGAAAASALRRRWSHRPEDAPGPPGGAGTRYLERLAEAVRIPTVSFEEPDRIDRSAFDRFHAFLAESYPLVHEHLRREVVTGHALLYTWEGADPDAPAVLLMAHQDVVPIEAGTEGEWSHEPFSGTIDGEFLWGRGSLDDKGALIAILEAVERLLADGFVPETPLLLAFGDDGEIGGATGARAIAEHLRSRDVRLDFVLDEGGVVVEDLLPGARAPLGLLGIGEKGHVNVSISASGEGGQPMAPPTSTAIGTLAEAIRRLEASPMPARLPVQFGLFRALATVLPFARRGVLGRPGAFAGLIERQMADTPATNALIRTTMAVTMIDGGVRPNVLPQQARAVVNVWVMPGDTIEGVLEHMRSVVGAEVVVEAVEEAFAGDPPPLSDPDGPGYQVVSETIGEVLGVGTAPWIVPGATDSRHFVDLAPGAVYRFAPFTATPSDLGRVQGADERLRVADADRAVAFFERLVRRACG